MDPLEADGGRRRRAQEGAWALLGAATFWGLFPLYLRELRSVPALIVIAYRSVLCCVFVMLWLWKRQELQLVRQALSNTHTRSRLLASALLISVNWLLYVWAVAHGRVLEASLGYFINPLINVLLGVVFLREQLRSAQWVAVMFAALGVMYLTWRAGELPVIACLLGLSFGLYGLIRKTIPVESVIGLAAETLLLTPLGAAYLGYMELRGQGAIALLSPGTLGLLACSGVLTAMPLWLFSFGARRLTYATVGLMGYISPTMQLLLGVYVFREPWDSARTWGFGLIWAGLALYSADALRTRYAA